jgi:hypothetical protein
VAPSTAAVKAIDILPDDDKYEGEDGEDHDRDQDQEDEEEEDQENDDDEDDEEDDDDDDDDDEDDDDGEDDGEDDDEDDGEDDGEDDDEDDDDDDDRLICMTRANQNNDIIAKISEHLPASESIINAPHGPHVHHKSAKACTGRRR